MPHVQGHFPIGVSLLAESGDALGAQVPRHSNLQVYVFIKKRMCV